MSDCKTCAEYDSEKGYCPKLCEVILRTVEELAPSIKGKWEMVGDNAWKCSVCGEISCCRGNYCPDCGARMEGEGDDPDKD